MPFIIAYFFSETETRNTRNLGTLDRRRRRLVGVGDMGL